MDSGFLPFWHDLHPFLRGAVYHLAFCAFGFGDASSVASPEKLILHVHVARLERLQVVLLIAILFFTFEVMPCWHVVCVVPRRVAPCSVACCLCGPATCV